MKTYALALLCCILTVTATSCLKTRAQLKENPDEEADTKAVPAKIQELKPPAEYVMDEIKNELTRMNGRIEDLEREYKHLQSSTGASSPQKDEIKKLETRMVELEQAQALMIESLKKAQETTVVDPVDLLEKAKTQAGSGNLDDAIASLTAYLKNKKAKSAELAFFMRAECYFKLKQYKKAIIDYSKFAEDPKYSKSQYRPPALFKIGQSFEALGMKDDAKGFYQDLVEKFPKSPEAKKAKKKIK